MIVYKEHHQLDKQKWDACVKASVNTSVFAHSWYLDAVCENWSALVLNDYEAVFPLTSGTKLGVNYLYQALFTRYSGVYSPVAISELMVSQFFDAIPEKFRYIEFSIHETNSFSRNDFQIVKRLFQTLDINKPYEEVAKEFKGDAKRNIKKATKSDLTVTEILTPEQIVTLFKENKGKELKGLHEKDYRLLENLMSAALKNDAGIMIGIMNSEKMLIAGGFFIRSRDRILFLKGSANAEGKSTGAMYLLLDHLFKTYAGKVGLFDFGGSSVETVASFNHNFGAKDSVYLQVKRNKLPFWIKLMSGKK